MKFLVKTSEKGLEFSSDYTRKLFQKESRERSYPRAEINFITPESNKMRRWFEGVVIPFITYYQEGFDYRSHKDNAKVREWVMQEFCGEFITVAGKAKKIAVTSKGKLKDLSERVIDWMAEQGYKTELLIPNDYKKWTDQVFPFGGPETYIDYLISLKKLP